MPSDHRWSLEPAGRNGLGGLRSRSSRLAPTKHSAAPRRLISGTFRALGAPIPLRRYRTAAGVFFEHTE